MADAGAETLGFFSFAPVGVAVLIAAILYMVFFGRRLLGRDEPATKSRDEVSMRDLAERYGVRTRIRAVAVRPGSVLVNQTAASANISAQWDTYVLAVKRQVPFGTSVTPATADTQFQAGDCSSPGD